jgi:hypothetical protein
LSSDDPKDIGHLIFPLANAYNGIKKAYINERGGYKVNSLYIVAVLEDEEKEMIKKM